ncbi:hypothetical protein P280DRAFT_470503 [Massarina eburnea CBS 473.64]|uniref:Uncharacterized protein n=1 Tax=Massarina eburnea CBS 473.64 TaxID=1395130 RepID=A0A6A6RWG9_9PLEO|nr:hypothetical protein P280DRAFT_470503 [Massarina eburnea CBS 473.64]
MSSSFGTFDRPWTPPDTDSESFADHLSTSPHLRSSHAISEQPKPVGSGATASDGRERSDSAYHSRASLKDSGFVEGPTDTEPQCASIVDPVTPELQTQHGIPRYPYTPDSARVPPRIYTLPPVSAMPHMPWDPSILSPVQNALSSCMSQMESLIQTRQPDDDQMEYIIGKFEEMTRLLSAPDAQSRRSDDHLFSEEDQPMGLGILTGGHLSEDPDIKAKEIDVAVKYIMEVGQYIDDVSRSTEDLKMRFDEARLLNSIQTEIITDLRRILKSQHEDIERYKEELEAELDADRKKEEAVKRGETTDQKTIIWAAICEALDRVGAMWLEW